MQQQPPSRPDGAIPWVWLACAAFIAAFRGHFFGGGDGQGEAVAPELGPILRVRSASWVSGWLGGWAGLRVDPRTQGLKNDDVGLTHFITIYTYAPTNQSTTTKKATGVPLEEFVGHLALLAQRLPSLQQQQQGEDGGAAQAVVEAAQHLR